jgi:TIR domain
LPDDNPHLRPREFLALTQFSLENMKVTHPNADKLLGGLFVSHSGADKDKIYDEIIRPVVYERFAPNSYFFYNCAQGAPVAKAYVLAVQAALQLCDKFMIVISENSIANEWVQAEVEWALEHSRPILAIRLGRWGWTDLLGALTLPSHLNKSEVVSCIDFSGALEPAQKKLAIALDDLLAKLPCCVR